MSRFYLVWLLLGFVPLPNLQIRRSCYRSGDRAWQVNYKEIERLTGYNLFPHHDLSSSLLAVSEETSDIDSSIINFFSANNKSTTTINKVTESPSPFSANTSFGSSEIDVDKSATNSFGSFKIDFPQISSSEVRTTKRTTAQIGSEEVSIPKIAVHDLSVVREVGVTEVDSLENTTVQNASSKNNFTQVQPTEITLSSSVSSQQFFSGDFSHNNFSVLINELNNTATKIWSDLLQPQTKLNINFQITDLPTTDQAIVLCIMAWR